MKYILILFLLPVITQAQIITTYAGNDTLGYNGNGHPATSARLCDPAGVAIDRQGNLYIADGDYNVVRKVNTDGIITAIAGSGVRGYGGDGGPAIDAWFNNPYGITADSIGNLYIADYSNNVIRKIDTFGIISTVAGNYALGYGYSGDGGPATAAQLYSPYAITVDKVGNLFIADVDNNVVRKVDASGTINTFAGNHLIGLGYAGDSGPATNAKLHFPQGVAADTFGNIYIADRGNNVIRKVDTTGIITTYAGSSAGTAGYSGDNGPATAAKLNTPGALSINDSGNLYISDIENNVIRKINSAGIISTVAGNGIFGYTGDGGLATLAELSHPVGITADNYGNFYFGDIDDYVVRKVDTSHISLNIHNINGSVNFSLYPNPAATAITITANNTISEIGIINLLGQQVFSQSYSSSSAHIDISAFPGGVYFVKINGSETAKFLKE